VAADPSGTASVEGPFCPKPLKSTGAGDRFNAGYCLGLIAANTPVVVVDVYDNQIKVRQV